MEPRLRTVQKVTPPYELNSFPKSFVEKIGAEIVFLLATSKSPSIEGEDWERIFASSIGADWKPSNVGLDDVVLGPFAWGAKTVKCPRTHQVRAVRLISGRNSPDYSFSGRAKEDDEIGAQVLDIWNARVDSLRQRFKEIRTVVLMKPSNFSNPKLAFSIFEFETTRFNTEDFFWKKNKRGNLEGFDKKNQTHKFTWQPHGSQFTVKELVPEGRLDFFLKKPESLNVETIMESIGYDLSWIEVVSRK